MPLVLQAAGLKFTVQQGRGRAVCPHKCVRGAWHSGQQCLGIGLWGWLGSDPHSAVAACGWLWKSCPCRPTLRSSESSSAVSGTAELTSMAGAHGNSWILPGITESLICLPVMGMRFNCLFSLSLFIEERDKTHANG